MKVKFVQSTSGHKISSEKAATGAVVKNEAGTVVIDNRHQIVGTYAYHEGQVVEVPDEQAIEFCAAGYCHQVGESPRRGRS